jgi:hypothetical protein
MHQNPGFPPDLDGLSMYATKTLHRASVPQVLPDIKNGEGNFSPHRHNIIVQPGVRLKLFLFLFSPVQGAAVATDTSATLTSYNPKKNDPHKHENQYPRQ